MRLESEPYDIVQDSAGDPSSLLTGISERRTYVGLLAFQRFVGMKDVVSMYDQRLAFNDRLLHSHSIDQLRELIKESQIRWYILWPDARPNWPESLLSTPLFERAGFRVYDLHQLKEYMRTAMDQNSSPIREFGSPILWFIAALFFVLAVLPVLTRRMRFR